MKQKEHFDLNDIQHEPTEAQLECLMNSVATDAKRRAESAEMSHLKRRGVGKLIRRITASPNAPYTD